MLDTSNVTDAELLDALRAVVAEKPDHVYTVPEHMDDGGTCYYVHTAADDETDLSPGCVVGCALNRLGVPLEALAEMESIPARSVVLRFFPRAKLSVRRIYNSTQYRQDRGTSWAAALSEAERDCE